MGRRPWHPHRPQAAPLRHSKHIGPRLQRAKALDHIGQGAATGAEVMAPPQKPAMARWHRTACWMHSQRDATGALMRDYGGADAMVLRGQKWTGTALVGRLPVGMGALSDTAALGDRGMSVLHRSCSARDEGRWYLPAGVCERAVVQWR